MGKNIGNKENPNGTLNFFNEIQIRSDFFMIIVTTCLLYLAGSSY